ncbi:MAG: hypothetical protein D6702_09985 [Planctomycetota bacterium]|nr:MAG: hypothetical protein D6702_09985 [Planctomycetota bacterium]
MRQRPHALLLSFLFLLPSTLAAAPAAQGSGTVLLRADRALLAGGEEISPVYVLIQDGKIRSVSDRPPRLSRSRPVEVSGTLAAGIVDAWGGPVPADLLRSSHRPGGLDLADSLPADLPGADPGLAARVAAARAAGVAAAGLSPGGKTLWRGLGAVVGFGAHDLPVAEGEPFLDLALGSAFTDPLNGQKVGRELTDLFQAAESLRQDYDDYPERLEKYEKDLEEYRKKLEEYGKKKEEAEQKAAAGKPQGQNGKGKGGQKPQPPKRPKRPEPPVPDARMERLLRALAGSLRVRIEANAAADIRTALDLKERHDLDLVLVGGAEADLMAEELAAARVPVVLPVVGEHGRRSPERSLARRFQALREAGVEVALASGGGDGSQALLLMRAGELVAAGLDPAEVWDALTVVPARILGLEGRRGVIAAGAVADLVLFGGSGPFDASAPLRPFSAHGGFDR